MKILVTGGAGFIGSNFILYLLDKYQEYKIYNLDKLTYAGNVSNLSAIQNNPRYTFLYGDICDGKVVDYYFKKYQFDLVIHFAAESHVDNSIENPGLFLETNIIGTQVLVNACKNNGNIRFHHVSTDEVYGDLPLDRKDLLFTEETPLNPSSPYSAAKTSSDLIVQAYYRTFGLPVTISRCSNNYGPFQFPEKLIPLMVMKASRDEKLPVYGTGTNVRDWLHVKDHCRAIDCIIHKGAIGEVYNIGGNNEKTNLEIVKMILDKVGKSEDLIEFVQDRKGHDLRYAIDAAKMKKTFGWEPEYLFDEGINETIDWYIEHMDWINHIVSGEYQKQNAASIEESKLQQGLNCLR